MYHLYHTEAFVVGRTAQGEAHALLNLFTREFGMITASATSVREERSKLRFGLQELSFAEVSLVRGSHGWRITNTDLKSNLFTVFRGEPEYRKMFCRIFLLLRRLLTGEEKNEKLFLTVKETFLFLEENAPPSLSEVEIVLVLRILHALGYLAPRSEFSPFLLDSLEWNEKILTEAVSLRTLALSHINHSLRESHL